MRVYKLSLFTSILTCTSSFVDSSSWFAYRFNGLRRVKSNQILYKFMRKMCLLIWSPSIAVEIWSFFMYCILRFCLWWQILASLAQNLVVAKEVAGHARWWFPILIETRRNVCECLSLSGVRECVSLFVCAHILYLMWFLTELILVHILILGISRILACCHTY